jgi:uncharacterized protein YciI
MTTQLSQDLQARLAGFRNLELYAIETEWIATLEQMQPLAQAHLDHQVALEARGVLFAAGPLFEEGAPRFPPERGLIVVRASSYADARAIAESDPMHRAGLRRYRIRRWLVNEGAFEISVRLSGGQALLR